MADRPWIECNRGKALTPHGLARRLKPFGIVPKTLRADGDVLKGYLFESFSDSFSRYIPGFQSVTPLQINEINELHGKQTVTPGVHVTVENNHKSLKYNDYHGVTVETSPNGARAQNDGDVGDEKDAGPLLRRIEI